MFDSALSVPGFALCDQLELTPVGQVMGNSVYQMGYQSAWGEVSAGYGPTGGAFMYELTVYSQALNEVRSLALRRLAEEATRRDADAVVGVSTRTGEVDSESGSVALEHTVLGTAVRRKESAKRQPVLTELSVAEYAQLLRAGFEPAGIVAWTSAFFAGYSLGMGGGLMMGAGMQNFELRDFTQAFYEARETVMGRLSSQAVALGASGVVGMRIDHTVSRRELGGGFGESKRTGLVVTFNAIGTAIRQRADAATQAPKPVLDLYA